ncbi:MAG: hypothetical protein HYU78_02920 [Rhodocyclales bacterium]|nr:hypothetical protein [Rhodocyclales bacterium]
MTAEELLQRLLAVEAPWQVVKVRDDLGRSQIDVWVGRGESRGGWLFGKRQTAAPERETAWRHLNLGHARCVVHAPPAAAGDDALPWSGDDGQPFTHALARQIAGLFREGIKFQSVCAMLDVAVADLWKFKHSLDHGRAGLSGTPALPAAEGASSVPAAEHPVWAMLLDGALDIDIRVLGLKLFLSKLREQMRLITDDEVRLLKAHEMQRYFVRYERQLGHELAQLRRY